MRLFRLDKNGSPVEIDMHQSDEIYFENILSTTISNNNITISTVFLGVDYTGKDPILFETTIIKGNQREFCKKYKTKDEAIAGHLELIKTLVPYQVVKTTSTHRFENLE